MWDRNRRSRRLSCIVVALLAVTLLCGCAGTDKKARDQVAELSDRVESINAAAGDLRDDLASSIDELDTTVADLSSRVDELEGSSPDASPDDVAARVDDLEAALEEATTRLQSVCDAISEAYAGSNSATDDMLFTLQLAC